MALAARERGYEYLAITDHSATHGFGNDVSPEQLRRQIELVREANARIEGIELLAGSEVNILPDGSLDYEDELLARARLGDRERAHLLRDREQAMTERMIAAIEHPLVDAIGHPTGPADRAARALRHRPRRGVRGGRAARTMLEINANPDRRDLSDVHAARPRVRACRS